MREIKFRGRRLDNREWEYGFLVIDESGECNLVVNYGSSYSWEEVDPQTVGQYTGLKDKSGKEVYEGDIVKQIYHAQTGHEYDGTHETFDGHHIGQVVITASQGVCMRKPLCWSEETDETTVSNQYKKVAGYRCEVIENICEKPEPTEKQPSAR